MIDLALSYESSSSFSAGIPHASDRDSANPAIPENPSGTNGASVSRRSLSSGIEDTSLETLDAERLRILGFRDM
ncbi:MAG: hypothetical protein Q4Q62_07020 [Thermoplasmata archaeon]|nr:hypothetical protein [Thermoplasmata archaeon]